MNKTDINNIPAEKFKLVGDRNLSHDVKLETKSRSYFYDAFLRFCKNKGSVVAAVVIIILVLFAILVPFFTEYTVSYNDNTYAYALPKSKLFQNTNFWDGCSLKTGENKQNFIYYYSIGSELENALEGTKGYNAIKNQEYTLEEDGSYTYRLDSYFKVGCKYIKVKQDEYNMIQDYQDETGIRVIYPTVNKNDRPQADAYSDDANYYYKTVAQNNKAKAVLDSDGNIIPVYATISAADQADPDFTDGYYSLRVEGKDGFTVDGEQYFYKYSRVLAGDDIEIRVNYYEYYVFKHTRVLKDGITEPCFLFGATDQGKDVLTNLASGARFSFIFAIIIASINMVLGAIYGAISGYYGGVTDLVMERISDILSAVPLMIVITLLKYYMDNASNLFVLFLAFVATGWIGMAGTTRMQFYRYKNQEYVLAARTLGARDWRIIWKHIFPNSLGTLVTSCALVIPGMIFSETSLSYLGIIDLSTGNLTSVGTLIALGQPDLTKFPHIALFPSLFLSLLMLSFNLFGNGLRDAFNPSLRGSEE